MSVSISAVLGIIIAIVILYIVLQLVLKWLAKAGIVIDGLVLYTLWAVLAILALLFLASAFGIPVPLVHW